MRQVSPELLMYSKCERIEGPLLAALTSFNATTVAAHRSFVSYIATVVEVVVGDKGNYSVPRVDTASDRQTDTRSGRNRATKLGQSIGCRLSDMARSRDQHSRQTWKPSCHLISER
jgi:hypothetical protein